MMLMQCKICHRNARLILNVCAECDPKLHAVYMSAVKSSINFETITLEMIKSYKLLQQRKEIPQMPERIIYDLGHVRKVAYLNDDGDCVVIRSYIVQEGKVIDKIMEICVTREDAKTVLDIFRETDDAYAAMEHDLYSQFESESKPTMSNVDVRVGVLYCEHGYAKDCPMGCKDVC